MELQTNFYTIGVKFYSDNGYGNTNLGPKTYSYKVPNEITLNLDDHVVVRVEGKDPQLKVVKVVEVSQGDATDANAPFKYKWIVQKVELAAYEERLENDQKLSNLVATLKNRKLKQSVLDEISSVATPEELAEVKKLSGLV